jgi:hypothetical protein
MPNTLEIPQANSTLELPQAAGFVPSPAPDQIDAILDRMTQRESSGNPRAVGKAGERGLLQIKPSTAAQYGVMNPDMLFNPHVNRYVARRYLTDLVTHYKGDISKAVEAYNAGQGNIDKGKVPASTARYMAYAMGGGPSGGGQSRFSVGGLLSNLIGEGTANAAEPEDYSGPELSVKPPPSGAPSARDKGKAADYSGPELSTKPPTAPAKPEPWPVRAAGWLPTAGQFVGEPVGAAAGAAIPGLGETGVPEYAGATAGGALGSAGGAVIENQIRKAYGLSPVSVGEQAAWGGLGSGVGGMIPLVSRFRKATKLAAETGVTFAQALEQMKNVEAGLEGVVGMGARKAKLLEDAPAASAQGAYGATRKAGLDELGAQYDTIIGSDAHKMTPTTAWQALQGAAGRNLELVGKSLRQSVEDEFKAQPMTVNRVQKLISLVRAQQRALNPETQGVAIRAYGDIVKALQADRDAVIGPSKAAAVKIVDQYYARQIARFPLKAVRKTTMEPEAAEAILKHKPTQVGRVLEVIREMKRTGQIAVLRRATAAKIWQAAKVTEAATPIAKLESIVKAVKGVEPEVFDELYGGGARKLWLETADALTKRQRELLQHPDQAAAIAGEVKKYLSEPGLLAKLMNHFLTHRAMLGALMMGGGMEFGSRELVVAGSGLVGIEMYEMVSHSRIAMFLLKKAATEKNSRLAARLIVSALSASMRGGAEHELGDNNVGEK